MVLTRALISTVVIAIGVFYQLALQPILYNRFGIGRPVEAINNGNCEIIKELEGCEGEFRWKSLIMNVHLIEHFLLLFYNRCMVSSTIWIALFGLLDCKE